MAKSKGSKHCKSHNHKKVTHFHKIQKTKRRTLDNDQIHENLKRDNAMKLLNQEVDHDVSGNAQNYCITCARYFIDDKALKAHFKTKPHKRRLKALETEPYTQEESNRAAGMGNYIAPKKYTIKAQPEKSELAEDYELKEEKFEKMEMIS